MSLFIFGPWVGHTPEARGAEWEPRPQLLQGGGPEAGGGGPVRKRYCRI